jgi:oxaloacetate decarboxylase alpha subunit
MKVFEHQVPGGMISNLVAQLEEQKASDRLPEVLAEIPRVRKDLGYPRWSRRPVRLSGCRRC